ncbi:MAG: hypothetical protein LW832_04600 [Parachlamydia sp.]|jgi:DNA gyrase/topoisomerase IV subunit A|nr:hypothetical protein [Parachlamydia sp.]
MKNFLFFIFLGMTSFAYTEIEEGQKLIKENVDFVQHAIQNKLQNAETKLEKYKAELAQSEWEFGSKRLTKRIKKKEKQIKALRAAMNNVDYLEGREAE